MKNTFYAVLCVSSLMICGCPLTGPVGTTDIVDAVIGASATRGPAPLTVTFSGGSSTSRGGAVTAFRWEFGGGATADGADATFTFNTPGRYPVTLRVTDAAGNVGVEILDIRVQGQNPTAVIAADRDRGERPLLVRFDGTASSAPDDMILDYFWDFADGQTSRLPAPQHVFSFRGQFIVTLRVVTAGGAEGSVTKVITVTDGTASLQFDGAQLATLPVEPAQTLAEFTLEAWCLPAVRGGTLADIGNRALLLEVLPETNVIRLQRGNDAFEVVAAGLAGDWIHVGLSYDAGGATVILNGTALETVAFAGDVAIPSIRIGTDFEGRIADVRLWSVARTAAEINAQATIRLSGSERNLLAYWPIDEGSGEILQNRAPAGADGFLGTSDAIEPVDPAWSNVGPPF